MLFRGFAKYRHYPSILERYGLRGLAIANYPMYRGLARLLGMTLHPITKDVKTEFEAVRDNFDKHDFFFLHVKATDRYGEDGNFDAKVKTIEEVDALVPILTALKPDVLAVTADHSTPAAMKKHSWHPVPVLLSAATARVDDVKTYDEIACVHGGLGRQPLTHLIGIALSHAGRLDKYGA
jgi:2,3-bisphosphoglycerate-independent phosphoglycerate mutase